MAVVAERYHIGGASELALFTFVIAGGHHHILRRDHAAGVRAMAETRSLLPLHMTIFGVQSHEIALLGANEEMTIIKDRIAGQRVIRFVCPQDLLSILIFVFYIIF